MAHLPEELKYSKTHVWVELMEDGSVKVGITDHAQQELGDIVYVELPETERSFASGEECAVVESVKSASDIYCPLNGEIVSANEALKDSPETINEDPYGEGWIFTLQPDDEGEFSELLDAAGYEEFINGEA
ncbi:MAG: glycine cleavage system protein GcvH [Gammaproteobacteria bacterium]